MNIKRLFSKATATLVLLLLCMAQGAWAETTVSSESALLTAVQSSQTVKLGADITLNSGRLHIDGTSDEDYGIITGGWAYQGAGIYVYEGCELTIR